MDIYKKMEELKIHLPKAPAQGGVYQQVKRWDNLACISGCGPDLNGIKFTRGKTGDEVSQHQAYLAAQNCVLNSLALLEKECGDLNQIHSFVKLLVFVASKKDFYNQPQVADGTTTLLERIFGTECGLPARSAVGVYVLPDNIPVEIELMVRMKS